MKLRDILGVLRDSYCRTIGIEYMHIQDPEQRAVDPGPGRAPARASPTRDEQLRILRRLNAAEAFETFLQTKYVGQKRFSPRGRRVGHPAARRGPDRPPPSDGLDEVCIGMPHRGRLNVLANIVGKSYGQIFREFEGTIDPRRVQGSGDVKYHLGTEGTFTADDGAQITVYLAANPSHLEAVNPVLEGIVRAKQDLLDRGEARSPVLPVLMHGDAAFAGQGVVAETLEPVAAARLPHRRHRPRRRQQPGRLHHVAGRQPLVGLRHRRRAHDPGADLPRERRRPRGRACGWRGSPSSSARRSTRTSSSTWSATAAAATTRPTTRR